jgi:hypothetical protein
MRGAQTQRRRRTSLPAYSTYGSLPAARKKELRERKRLQPTLPLMSRERWAESQNVERLASAAHLRGIERDGDTTTPSIEGTEGYEEPPPEPQGATIVNNYHYYSSGERLPRERRGRREQGEWEDYSWRPGAFLYRGITPALCGVPCLPASVCSYGMPGGGYASYADIPWVGAMQPWETYRACQAPISVANACYASPASTWQDSYGSRAPMQTNAWSS